MDSNKKLVIVSGFNKQFNDFLAFVQKIFPDDVDIATLNNSIQLIQRNDPNNIIEVWYDYVTKQYIKQIEANDIQFFFNKDYTSDLASVGDSEFVVKKINGLRGFVKSMSVQDQTTAMKFLQKLCNLSKMYFA